MRTTSGIQFYCRNSKMNKQGLAPLELSIILNGSRRFINLPTKFNPEEFNKKRPSTDIVEVVDVWRDRINSYIREMMLNDVPLTADGLRNIIQTGGIKSYTIEDLINDYMAILKKRVDVDLTPKVYRKYELVAERFYNFIDKSKECSNITNSLIQRVYAEWNSKFDKSTTAGMMTRLKSFIRFGMDNDKIKINPFTGIKIQKPKKHITYLTEAEIQAVIGLKIENKSMERVRDIFTLLVGTGLSYCDLKTLQQTDIKESNGTYYIKKTRGKTGQEYTAVILPFAVPVALNLPEIISNQKLNQYLKLLGDMAKLNKNLTCHMLRHSYCTLLYNRGVSITTVAKAAGHSNIRTTQQFYAQLFDSTVIEEIKRVL